MNSTDNYITAEKRKLLEIELAELEGPKRKEILVGLEYAKSLGDLSENAEYHQVREDQGKLEERISKIKQILESSETIVVAGGDTVEMGSTVVVQKDGTNDNKTYVIVGSEEADMAKGKISNHSPFGSALYGQKKGSNISFSTPSGVANYKIINVS